MVCPGPPPPACPTAACEVCDGARSCTYCDGNGFIAEKGELTPCGVCTGSGLCEICRSE